MVPASRNSVNYLTKSLAPLVERRTYKNALYLVLSFPLGFLYSTFLGFGFVFGVGLSFIVFGIFILGLLLFTIQLLTVFERWLSTALLGVEIEPPDDVVPTETLYDSVKIRVDAGSTWRGLGFLTLKIWFGIVGILLLIAFSTAFSMVSAVVRRPHEIEFGELNGEPVVWTVETLPETALAVVIGLVGMIFLAHLANGFAYVAGRMSITLLGACRSET